MSQWQRLKGATLFFTNLAMSQQTIIGFYRTTPLESTAEDFLHLAQSIALKMAVKIERSRQEKRPWTEEEEDDDAVSSIPSAEVVGKWVSVEDIPPLLLPGTQLQIHPDYCEFIEALQIAIEDEMPKEIRGSLGVNFFDIKLGSHFVYDFVLEEEDVRCAGETQLSLDLWCHNTPSDWPAFETEIKTGDAITQVRRKLEECFGGLGICVRYLY